jgi:hypothetical protein
MKGTLGPTITHLTEFIHSQWNRYFHCTLTGHLGQEVSLSNAL